MQKFLNKSNSYNFYKNNYNKLNKEYETLNKNYKKINKKNKKLKKKNKKLRRSLDFTSNEKDAIIKIKEKAQVEIGKITKPKILEKLKNNEYNDLTISIKSPNPVKSRHWGDYFFALEVKESLDKLGFNTVIHERDFWYDNEDNVDISILLRGLDEYAPNFDEINVMWNISHPELVKNEEYEKYDIVFVASESYSEILNERLDTIVEPLLQCTNPNTFYEYEDYRYYEDILFVGVTRDVFRQIVKDCIDTNHEISVYGKGWEKFIDEKSIKGEFIDNKELYRHYSSCKILLNDHWEDMRILDFPSNRLFDALACGAFIISDEFSSAESLFEGSIVTYKDSQDLDQKIEYYLNNDNERKLKAKKGKELVLKYHTFDNRIDTMINELKTIKLN